MVRGRAEELAGTRTFDVVTARAVAPLERLARWCLPLVDPSGELVAMKGASARAEVEAAGPALTALGCADPVVVELGVGGAGGADLGGPPRPAGIRAGRLARSSRQGRRQGERSAEDAVSDGTGASGGLGWPDAPSDPREFSTGLGWPDERVPPQEEPTSPQATEAVDGAGGRACFT